MLQFSKLQVVSGGKLNLVGTLDQNQKAYSKYTFQNK